jgi:hypothetical protein
MNAGRCCRLTRPKENIVFARGEEKITIYHDDEVERGFCSVCGSTLFWNNPAENISV